MDRIATILEAIALDPKGTSVSGLAHLIDLPKSTIYSLVHGLLSVGLLKEEAGLLTVGPTVAQIASTQKRRRLSQLAHHELSTLAAQTQETAQLCVKDGYNIFIVEQVESGESIRCSIPLRTPRSLLSSASGKLFLAEMEPSELERVLKHLGQAASNAANTIRSQRLTIRQSGVAFNCEETLVGVTTLGASVRGGKDTLLAGLVVAGPTERMHTKIDRIEHCLYAAAQRLRTRLY
ncbi:MULTISPECIES: IclR family transcriptional regulator [unclassified Rhodococcus (in: high G+C Gram-positive bacteria)]|uniref:IclR family transcriptional regulator n=1 Tax=unclassified Rhodococcus (in: high G+C Gram-positive bacteria) TaxID=192944 RepID=UPI0015E8DB16|nr:MULTISPECIES: IclR family transcriptional regulator [unclassified Rhodococcus (in: high G+C Gram-positive bacteria)]